MKIPLLFTAIFLFMPLSVIQCDADSETIQEVDVESIEQFEGFWISINMEGEDSGQYKEVLDAVTMEINKDGKCIVIATYKKDVIIHFKGNPNMTKDGKVTSQLVIKKVKGGFKVHPVDDLSDISSILLRDGKLVTKADDEDVTMIFSKQKANKQKAESGRREVLTPAPHTTGHTDLPSAMRK